jgi:HSP20 family protein
MTIVMRREPFGLELPSWMARLLDERSDWLDKDALRIEEYVEDGTLVIRTEMPGVDVDKDVDIMVLDGMLHIKAERTETTEKKEKAFYRSEFRYGVVERAIPLPAGATVDDVKATYRDGMLEIRLPARSRTPEAGKIPVQRIG